jgi:diguanylate cyclase (GGDEF)-like protein/PAS domain S-box-containing protein
VQVTIPSKFRLNEALLVFALLLTFLAFGGGLLDLVHRWYKQEEYSHGFFLPLISLWLLWSRRQALRDSVGAPSTWGLVVLALSAALLVLGEVTAIFLLIQLGFLLALVGVVLCYGGVSLLRMAWLPIAFLLFAIPLLLVLLVWTNEFDKMQFSSAHVETGIPFTLYHVVPGPAWRLVDLVAALLVAAGAVLFIFTVLRAPRGRRGQLVLFLLGALPPTLLRLLFRADISPLSGIDLTPVGLALTGACLLWGILRYDLSRVVPLARERVIAALKDGIVVLDERGAVMEINPAAQAILGISVEQALSRPLRDLVQDPTGILRPNLDEAAASRQIIWGLPQGEPRGYALSVTTLVNPRGKANGKIVVLRDINSQKQGEEQLQAANDQLEYIVSQRTLALRQANSLLEVRLSEREKAENALRQANDQLITLLNNFPGFVILKDTGNIYRMASRMFLQTMGISNGDIANKTDNDFYAPAVAAAEREADQRTALTGQSVYLGETTWLHDGQQLVLDRRKVPIKDGDGRVGGVITLAYDITDRKRAEDALTRAKNELEVRVTERTAELRQANQQLEIELMERKRAEEQLRYMSMHDPMTGLYNRAYFEEELLRLAQSRQYPISIIMADTDHLKETNDRLGHAVGDELLRLTAVVLKSVFRSQDVVARIGGDEFCILMPETDETTAQQTLERIRARVALNNLQRPDLSLGLSLGTYTAQRGEGLSEALKQADVRMYQNKKARRVGR